MQAVERHRSMDNGCKVLVIIPAYNEAESIEHVIGQITKYPSTVDSMANGQAKNAVRYDYLIINDGSTDNTLTVCKEKHYHYLDLPINLGIGGAVQAGYAYADKNGYDIAVQIDGDGQHDISYLGDMLEPLLSGEADVVIGSRFLRKEGFQSSFARRTGSRLLSRLVRLTTGKKIYDVTSGYRAVNRRFIEIYSKDYPTDFPEPEAIVTAVMYRGKVLEVPVQMRAREGGKSSINFRKSVYYMIKVTLAILVCRLSYGIRRDKGRER